MTIRNVGADRQLFIDDFWVERSEGVTRALHSPIRREAAIPMDKPWEDDLLSYMVTFWDEDRYRAWYRVGKGRATGYAESTDGIQWEKPTLGIVDFNGSKENNLIWNGPGGNMSVFRDPNPDVPEDEQYKGIVCETTWKIFGLVSPDGLHWRLKQEEPILTRGPFDSHNIAFWDTWQEEYVAYTRGVANSNTQPIHDKQSYEAFKRGLADANADPDADPAQVTQQAGHGFLGGVRSIRRASSKDFVTWTSLENIDYGDTTSEDLYTNSCIQYERAPGTYLMFPSRFVPHRMPDPDWVHGSGLNDVVFMSSRDGFHFDRSFMEAFVRPGLDKNNWHERAIYMERGLIETSPTEISIYGKENMKTPSGNIRRYSLRTDGFVSVNAGYSGGELTTRPFVFEGRELELNYSTSAVGSVRVEVQDADGAAIPGLTLADCTEMFADTIDGKVMWEGGGDVSSLAGKPVRLRFALMDADLYAFKFNA